MGWVIAIVLLLPIAAPASAADVLPSRDLMLAPFAVESIEPMSFDLIDFRTDQRFAATARLDVQPHSVFAIKRHLGAAAGYENGIAHASIGFYLTVAEWGRWNFGVPAVEFGFGHYPSYDRARDRTYMKSQPTLIVSLASVHYRVGYLRSFGVNWYINLEQVYDLRDNLAGSQFGFSFSRK